MKILYHHRTRARDGSAVHIRSVVEALRRRGHEVSVVGPPRVPAPASSREGELPFPARLAREALEYGYGLVGGLRLLRAAARARPGAIYERYAYGNAAGWLASRVLRVPLVLEVNSPLVRELAATRGLVFPSLAERFERALWRGADRLACVTGALADEARARGVPPDRVLVNPNGVDPDRFRPDRDGSRVRDRHGLGDALVVGFVGYLRAWHGLETGLEAFARFDLARAGARLLLVGDGPARRSLEAMASTLGLSEAVRHAGEVPHEAAPDYVAAFDVAWLPSINPYASPLKLFEYMAAGRAVVAPKIRNVEEVVTDGRDAILVPPRDPEALGRATRRLLEDRALRERLGTAARERIVAGGFTWDENAARVEAALADLAGTS